MRHCGRCTAVSGIGRSPQAGGRLLHLNLQISLACVSGEDLQLGEGKLARLRWVLVAVVAAVVDLRELLMLELLECHQWTEAGLLQHRSRLCWAKNSVNLHPFSHVRSLCFLSAIACTMRSVKLTARQTWIKPHGLSSVAFIIF